MKKKFPNDGKSRPSTDLYRKNFNDIFGKKIKKDEEVEGYYIDGYAFYLVGTIEEAIEKGKKLTQDAA